MIYHTSYHITPYEFMITTNHTITVLYYSMCIRGSGKFGSCCNNHPGPGRPPGRPLAAPPTASAPGRLAR